MFRPQPRSPSSVQAAVALLGVVVFLAALGVFAYTGSFARYWADDYCYSSTANNLGLVRGVVDWYRTSGNRFSALLAVGVSEWFGTRFIQILPGLTLLSWVCAWFFCLYRLSRLLGRAVPARWLALAALGLVYFNVLLAPDRLQTVYWRMGTLHFTWPAVLLLVNLGLAFWRLSRPANPGRDALSALLCGLVAFFSAGLSETAAGFQAGAAGLLLLACLLKLSRITARRGVWMALAALSGSLLAVGVMAFSPSNAWRLAVMPAATNYGDLARYTLRYALDFVWDSLKTQPVPLLVFSAAAGAMTFLAVPTGERQPAWRAVLAGLALSVLAAFAVILCSFAPSAYAGLQYPSGRNLMPSRFIFLAGLAGLAFFAGLGLRRLFRGATPRWAAVLAVLVLLGAFVYPLRELDLNRREISVLVVKAARWDARDAQIRQQRAAGRMDVLVKETDVIQGLQDLAPDPGFWINACVAGFYRVASITAEP